MTVTYDPFQQQKLLALGELAGGVAHDFNNILSIIEGYARMLQRDMEADAIAAEKLRHISLATRRGSALTRQMLAFGRQHIIPPKNADLVDVVRENRGLLDPLLNGRVQVSLTLPDGPVYVPCDADIITHIIINMTTNARDAMPDGGTVTFHVVPSDGRALLMVSDTGTGIPPDILPRIFDPFFTTKDQGKGTGLGLSMVAGLMQQVGGYISVNSSPGAGTCFTLDFPRVDGAPVSLSQRVATQPEQPILEEKTILIVDDEEELLGIIEDDLRHMGLRVLKAANAARAMVLQQEYKGSIDLLLTDIVMPGISGVQLAEKFAEFRPDTQVVFMTGYPHRGDAARLGACAHMPDDALVLPKPFQTVRLSDTLQKALNRIDRKSRL